MSIESHHIAVHTIQPDDLNIRLFLMRLLSSFAYLLFINQWDGTVLYYKVEANTEPVRPGRYHPRKKRPPRLYQKNYKDL